MKQCKTGKYITYHHTKTQITENSKHQFLNGAMWIDESIKTQTFACGTDFMLSSVTFKPR